MEELEMGRTAGAKCGREIELAVEMRSSDAMRCFIVVENSLCGASSL
jgi:hypothetical protein